MSEQKKIFTAIPKIMLEIEPIAKEQTGKGISYKFRGIDDIYNAVQKIMAKHGVFTVPTIISRHREKIISQGGTPGILVLNQYIFRFYAEDGSYVEAHADGEGIDYADKGSNKCASIAHKYALLQTLCIPTDDMDDPDREGHVLKQNKPQAAPAQKPVAAKQDSFKEELFKTGWSLDDAKEYAAKRWPGKKTTPEMAAEIIKAAKLAPATEAIFTVEPEKTEEKK